MRVILQFPTFPMRDPALDPHAIDALAIRMRTWTARVNAMVPVPDDTFEHPDRATLANDADATYRAHLASFIESLAIADWQAPDHRADGVIAYSMGLYAALVYTGALEMGDALHVMLEACALAHRLSADGPFAMAALTGIDAAGLRRLIATTAPAVELSDEYTSETQIVTGVVHEVEAVLAAAVAGGVTEVLQFPVSAPFHSTALRAAEHPLARRLERVAIEAPCCPIRSATVPAWLHSAADVRAEIVRNVWHPMHWLTAIRDIAAGGAAHFVECGTSRRLTSVVHRELGPPHTTWSLADHFPSSDV